MASGSYDSGARWFVMRDLKRSNARTTAYKMLKELGFEVFTPVKWRVFPRKGANVREEVPVVQDLLFVHSERRLLDPVVEKTATLQYRFMRNTFREPMTVGEDEMEKFIRATDAAESVRYYMPEELGPETYNRKIRIIGGKLDGYEGFLVTVRGSRTRRLLVELPGLLSAGVEVSPEYIAFI